MRYLYAILFLLGLAAYATAILNIGNNTGETMSDTGNAVMLTNCALMLLVSRWQRAGHASA